MAALAAMNSSLAQMNCSQVLQCPTLYAALDNVTSGIEHLLHDPWEVPRSGRPQPTPRDRPSPPPLAF
eukprot:3697946-Prymnesium_polylepis.1